MADANSVIHSKVMQLSCPYCGEPSNWKAWWIEPHSFTGECKLCNKRWRSPLPDLDTKLIALDTNACSELMKLVNPTYPEERKARVPSAWKQVLERLKAATRLHAVCCPRSPTLERECALFQHGPAIVQAAKSFHGGLTCQSSWETEGQQLNLAARAHARGEQVKQLDRHYVFHGQLNGWSNLFRIEVEMGIDRFPLAEVRANRQKLQDAAKDLFASWSTGRLPLNQEFDRERLASGRVLVKHYMAHLQRLGGALAGDEQFDPLEFLHPTSSHMAMIRRGLEGPDGADPRPESVINFALTEQASKTPVNLIRSALYAFEAAQVARGMCQLKASMWLDVEFISTMLPYVDAMLVEAHFAEGIKQVRNLLPAECQGTPVFSTRALDKFVRHLDEIIANVPQEQRRAADALYPPAQRTTEEGWT